MGQEHGDLRRTRASLPDAQGVPLAIQLTGANRNDSQQALHSSMPSHLSKDGLGDPAIVPIVW